MRERFLICFGAQRGGTTWLHQQLYDHPAFDLPPRKEIRYLDPIYVHDFAKIQQQRLDDFRNRLAELGSREIDPQTERQLAWAAKYALVSRESYSDNWYRSLFDGCDPEKITGDLSPDYSLLPDEGVARLARLHPHAKLVFMARDPVDRAISGAKYAMRRLDLPPEELARKITASALGPRQTAFSRYDECLSRFRRHFEADRILVAFHDDIATDPHRVLRSICEHVGVDFDPADFPAIARDVNRGPERPTPGGLTDAVAENLRSTLDWLANDLGGHAVRWRERHATLAEASRTASVWGRGRPHPP